MAAQTADQNFAAGKAGSITRGQWLKIGLAAGIIAVILVLLAQALALSVWPQAAAFRPLNSYPRTILFTLIPALVATALFARLARGDHAAEKFLKIAIFVLLLSFIPDYTLPDANRTLVASSIAAFLHLVAGLAITGVLIAGYNRAVSRRG